MDRLPKNAGEHSCCDATKRSTWAGQANGSTISNKPKSSSSSGDELGQIDEIIGDFGRYQFLIFMFKILIGVTSAFNNLGVTFFAPSDFVAFRCADQSAVGALNSSSMLNSTAAELGGDFLGNVTRLENPYLLHGHSRVNSSSLSILQDFLSNGERAQKHSLNLNYDTPERGSLQKECQYLSASDNEYHKCTAYQYDTGIWISTIIDEWDLVCDRAWFISATQSLYMTGFILSYMIFGYLSDRLGRWNSLFIGAVIEVACGFGCAFANSVTAFMISRLLLGIGNAGRSSSSYLIMIEWTGPKWRMHISTLGSIGWAIGYSLMPWITMYFLHFRHMQLFACLYEIVFVIWLLWIPESPRWLLTHRKFDEAYEVLLKAAKFNRLIKTDSGKSFYATALAHSETVKIDGTEKSSHLGDDFESATESSESSTKRQLEPYTIEEFNVKFQHLTNTICAKEFTSNENKLTFFDLIKWPNLRGYLVTLALVWAFNSFIYYGIVLRVGDFGGRNLFVTFTWAGLTELPSMAFTILFMKFLPRRTTNLVIFSLVGLLCAIQVPLKYYNYQWLQQSSMMLAKLFNACSFTCILYQTIELFPTSIRQTSYSACSLAGRIGSIVAPFIKELSQMTSTSVPPVIYALLSLVSAVLIKQLPETKGSDLPDTLLEAEKFQGTDKVKGSSASHSHYAHGGEPTLHHDSSDSSLIRRKSVTRDGIFIDEFTS